VSPRLNRAIAALQTADTASCRLLSLCAEIELRESPGAPTLSAYLLARPKINLDARKFLPLFAPDTLVVAGQSDADRAVQSFSVHPTVDMVAPVSAFTQVNQSVNQMLVAKVLAVAARHNTSSFVDAYAGAGNFALPLLACGLVGEAIDTCAAGIYCARAVARDRGWPYDGFQVGDARTLLESFVHAKRTFDLVLLDPPRQGAKNVLEVALKLRPRLIVLVACDPVALARDLKWLVAKGATVDSLTLYDMFPQTHHFETLATVCVPYDA
jgi:tRNA/tmRNA/rRNA uracil-C5-methylase (TrmA/RlmC/RlmD family)